MQAHLTHQLAIAHNTDLKRVGRSLPASETDGPDRGGPRPGLIARVVSRNSMRLVPRRA